MLTIIGGVYIERCIQPLWDAVFGSGGRAAAAVSGIVSSTTLVSYVEQSLAADVEALAQEYGFQLQTTSVDHTVSFDYLHPLSTPRITPPLKHIKNHNPLIVEGKLVLRFGMLEGDAIVNADIAVYDPQSAFGAHSFSSNGSTAKHLAIVLNLHEAKSLTGTSVPSEAAEWLMREDGAEVVVLKMGGHGVYVATRDKRKIIPAYRSELVWKIGSGDVFSAAFTAFWGAHGIDPFIAADLASRATAVYCNQRLLPILNPEHLRQTNLEPVTPGGGTIYLAGPFFDIAQRWLIEEVRSLLSDMGAKVFSPVHEVGPGPGEIVAPEDLKGIEEANIVFAILNGLDTGTVFEIGYAVKKGVPVVAFAQNIKNEDLKMLVGTKCEVLDDLVSAIYHAIWKLPQE